VYFLPLFEQGDFVCESECSMPATSRERVFIGTSTSDVNFLAGTRHRFIRNHFPWTSLWTSVFAHAITIEDTQDGDWHVKRIIAVFSCAAALGCVCAGESALTRTIHVLALLHPKIVFIKSSDIQFDAPRLPLHMPAMRTCVSDVLLSCHARCLRYMQRCGFGAHKLRCHRRDWRNGRLAGFEEHISYRDLITSISALVD
jgi:hypothetical protein